MESYAGRLLVATPALMDPNFWRAVILIIQHDDDGALGVVLNRPTLEDVGDHLPGWANAVLPPGKVHFGGPVEPEVAIALARNGDGEPTGLAGISMADLNQPDAPDGVVARIFSGYAGWSPGQLEAEITEGAWFVVAAHPDDPFLSPGDTWRVVLRRQPGNLALLSTFPIDVDLN